MPLEDTVLFPNALAGGEDISEGANAPLGNVQEMVPTGGETPLRRSGRNRQLTQNYVVTAAIEGRDRFLFYHP
jgi:hypothetical protein